MGKPPSPCADDDWLKVHLYRDGYREEGWVPHRLGGACHLERADAYFFYVRLFRRAPTDPLGVSYGPSPDGKRLVVLELRGGLQGAVEAWNRGCAVVFPRDVIRTGDTILSVNGIQE